MTLTILATVGIVTVIIAGVVLIFFGDLMNGLLIKNPDTSEHFGGGQPGQEISPEVIDPLIYPLVVALSETGFSMPVASCQGHWESTGFIRQPYVSFTAREDFAWWLSEAIHSEDTRRKLYFYWDLHARFGPDGLLHYSLELTPAQLKEQTGNLLPWKVKLWWDDFRNMEKADVSCLVKAVQKVSATISRIDESRASDADKKGDHLSADEFLKIPEMPENFTREKCDQRLADYFSSLRVIIDEKAFHKNLPFSVVVRSKEYPDNPLMIYVDEKNLRKMFANLREADIENKRGVNL